MLRPIRPQTGATAPEGWDREFYDYVMSLRLSGDLKYILVKQNSNGTSVSLNLQALLDSIPASGGGKGGGAEYNGYFKIIDVSDETGIKVKVVDGFSEDLSIETKAGICILNDYQYEIDVKTLPITGNCFIYLESDYNTTTKTSSKPVITQYAGKKEAEANKSYFLLYRVRFMDGVITRISREFYGVPQMFMWGSCDD